MAFDDVDWSQSQGARYPDMTPAPPGAGAPPQQKPATALDKAWIPTSQRDVAGAPERIRNAIWQAWTEAPSGGTDPGNMSILTRPMQEAINNNLGWFGRNVVNPAFGGIPGIALGGLAAGGAAVGSTLSELAGAYGVPDALIRDANLAAQGLPADIAARGVPTAPAARVPGTSTFIPNPILRVPPAEAPYVTPQTMPSYMQPIVAARQAQREQIRGLLDNPAAPPAASPTGVSGPLPPPPGYTPPGPAPVTTAGQAADISGQYYRMNRNTAGSVSVPPSALEGVYNSLKADMPLPGPGQVFAKDNPISGFVSELDQYRGQPMTLAQAQDLYRRMGEQVSAQYRPDGLTATGQALFNAQQDLRYEISRPGNDPWAAARQAWAQSAKMDDLQRIVDRADSTSAPATFVQNQAAALLRNKKAMRGYSPDEEAALQKVADGGAMADLLRTMASRFVPQFVGGGVGAALGAVGGPLMSAAGGLAGVAAGELARQPIAAAFRDMQLRRLQNAIGVLGRGVPPPVPTGWSGPPAGP